MKSFRTLIPLNGIYTTSFLSYTSHLQMLVASILIPIINDSYIPPHKKNFVWGGLIMPQIPDIGNHLRGLGYYD